MDEALARAQALVDEYGQELTSTLPPGAEIFDAHVHLGQDIDGFSGSYADLMALNERYGISRCFMFCLDEPDRHPAFRAANDRTLAYAKRSGGTLIPSSPPVLVRTLLVLASHHRDFAGCAALLCNRGPSTRVGGRPAALVFRATGRSAMPISSSATSGSG